MVTQILRFHYGELVFVAQGDFKQKYEQSFVYEGIFLLHVLVMKTTQFECIRHAIYWNYAVYLKLHILFSKLRAGERKKHSRRLDWKNVYLKLVKMYLIGLVGVISY